MNDRNTIDTETEADSALPLSALEWRFVGPYRGGRAMAVAGHPTASRTFYAGTSSGGVWRTENAGEVWRNITDPYFKRASVGALAIAEADPSVIYVGTGECGLRTNVTHGDGIYRSTDGGESWLRVGLPETQNIARIRIHPHDPTLVYVAAFGHRFGPNAERGVYRSQDAGKRWERVLFTNPETGAIDLSMDPQNPRILFAAMWQAQIFPWSRATIGPGSALFRSVDGGDTWTEVSDRPGFPRGIKGRIGVTVSPVRSGRVWAIVDAREGGIYRSDDGGETWTWLSDDRNFLVRPWYFGHVLADPGDPEGLYVVNRKLWRSRDGGRSYRQVNVPYVDQMDLWVDPREPSRMALGNDGGAAVSFDAGESWSTLTNQPTAEIYRVAADTHFPYRIYGSQQDNSTLCLPSRSDLGKISAMEWYDVGGGESGFIAVRPDNPNIVYSSDLPGLGVTRYDHETRQIREINPWGEVGSDERGRLRYRFNWSVPVVLSPHDPNVLYVAGNQVFRSTDDGSSWEIISPDLTRNDHTKLTAPPGSNAVGESNANHHCTISSFAESAHTPGILWAGSDDGLVHLSRDNGESWANVTPPAVPSWSTVHVEPSAHDPAVAYVAAAAFSLDDFRPYLFKTGDFGASWVAITNGIPDDEFVRVVRADPVQPRLLYAGTEAGVHVSLDDGGSWRPLRLNMPAVAIHDLIVKDADLVLGTHGRGMWILDDVSPLRELAKNQLDPTLHLFRPTPVYRLTRHVYGLESLIALYHGCAAANPPSGVVIYYLLQQPANRVTVSLIDEKGAVVNTFDSRTEPRQPTPIGPMVYQLRYGSASLTETVAGEVEPGIRWGAQTLDRGANPRRLPTATGLHRVTLDITYPGARPLPGVPTRGITAPIVPPGTYLVRLVVDGEMREQPVEIRPDPRLTTTPAEYRAQFELIVAIRDAVSEIHECVISLRNIRSQIEARIKPLADIPQWAQVRKVATNILVELTDIERGLIQPNLHERSGELDSIHFPIRLNSKLELLGYQVARSDDPPTDQSRELFADLTNRANLLLDRWRRVLDEDVAEFNRVMREAEVPAVIPPCEPQD